MGHRHRHHAGELNKKLFHAFAQIDSGLTRSQEGTGLGLVMVAKLVESRGSNVALESKLGEGSRFIVTLPQLTPAPGAAAHFTKPATCAQLAVFLQRDVVSLSHLALPFGAPSALTGSLSSCSPRTTTRTSRPSAAILRTRGMCNALCAEWRHCREARARSSARR